MALRIGQPSAASFPAVLPTDEEGMVPPEAPEMMADGPMMMGPQQDGRVSQESARYFGPEYRCAGCVHYLEGPDGAGECEIVAGPIDPEGVCSLFDPDVDALGAEEPMMEAEAPEMPIEGEEELA